MKPVILTCDAWDYKERRQVRQRFVIDINECGDARIRNEQAPVIERDQSANISIGESVVTLAVEAA